jgi:hypothetical protein
MRERSGRYSPSTSTRNERDPFDLGTRLDRGSERKDL